MGSATALIAGHTDSVLCLEVQPGAGKLLASGGEDGLICLTDLSTLQAAGAIRQTLGDAVPSLCWSPCAGGQHTLFAAAGCAVLELDLRRGLDASAAVRSFAAGQEEVNSVAASAANGGWLAAGDDGGEVQVISLQQAQRGGQDAQAQQVQQAQRGSQGQQADPTDPREAAAAWASPAPCRPPSYKTLRRGHSNICSAVSFRPHRPWELLSGGLDCAVVRWDFSRLRPLHAWSLSGEAAASGGQLLNPPMVHSLAVPPSDERELCRLVAAARGDGRISILDGDHKDAASSGGGSGSRGGGGRKGGRARGQGAAAASAGQPPPGRLALLGRQQGGHTAAVNSVAFVPASGCRQLLSAGNDRRVLLWNWRQACAEPTTDGTAAGQEAAQQADEPQPAAAAGSGCADEAVPLLAAEHCHGRKVNRACPVDVPACPFNVLLADTGRRITALHLS